MQIDPNQSIIALQTRIPPNIIQLRSSRGAPSLLLINRVRLLHKHRQPAIDSRQHLSTGSRRQQCCDAAAPLLPVRRDANGGIFGGKRGGGEGREEAGREGERLSKALRKQAGEQGSDTLLEG